MMPVRDTIVRILHTDRGGFSHRFMKTVVTFLMAAIAWVFFRAESFGQAFAIIRNMLPTTPWTLFDGTMYRQGLGRPDFLILLAGLVILVFADVMRYNRVSLSEKISLQPLCFRWAVYIIAVVGISIFGIWGGGYNAANFIYVQF
jgi:hypothetical protein